MMKVFVYGSLKRGFSNAAYLRGQRFLGAARSAARYRMFDCGGYPGITPLPEEADGGSGAGAAAVQGEIWEVDEECLARLDRLEGIEHRFYRRGAIDLAPENAAHEDVAAYFWEGATAGLREVGGGVWTRDDERRRGR